MISASPATKPDRIPGTFERACNAVRLLREAAPHGGKQVHIMTVLTRANGQPALAFYSWDEEAHAYLPFALNVMSFRGSQISDVTASIFAPAGSAAVTAWRRIAKARASSSESGVGWVRTSGNSTYFWSPPTFTARPNS